MKYTEYRILMLRDGTWYWGRWYNSPHKIPTSQTKKNCEILIKTLKECWRDHANRFGKKPPEAWKIQRRTVEVTEWEDD